MPELPEVEFARRCWESWAKGRVVRAIAAEKTRVLRPSSPRALQPLRGATITSVDRRGKNLLIHARLGTRQLGLWSHLGMTGKWVRRPAAAPAPKFSRVQVTLDDGHILHYCDMRLFGRLRLIDGARWDTVPELVALGPDPLVDGVNLDRLAARLAVLRVPVKVALLDQSLVAGVGNIQASEALFRARIDPRRPARSLDRDEVRRLAAGIRASIAATVRQLERVTKTGDVAYVEEPGTPNPFSVYDRAGERCRRGKGTIVKIVQAGRSTYYCPSCQK